eukprot:scaffold11075_cov132-Isochrysis_galbana.AAC.2
MYYTPPCESARGTWASTVIAHQPYRHELRAGARGALGSTSHRQVRSASTTSEGSASSASRSSLAISPPASSFQTRLGSPRAFAFAACRCSAVADKITSTAACTSAAAAAARAAVAARTATWTSPALAAGRQIIVPGCAAILAACVICVCAAARASISTAIASSALPCARSGVATA